MIGAPHRVVEYVLGDTLLYRIIVPDGSDLLIAPPYPYVWPDGTEVRTWLVDDGDNVDSFPLAAGHDERSHNRQQ